MYRLFQKMISSQIILIKEEVAVATFSLSISVILIETKIIWRKI
jgi:hypothetical protein